MHSIAAWWPWMVGLTAVALLAALAFRRRVRFYLRVAKALTRDERLPRPLRWTVGVGLVAKAMPIDFGIDEIALGLAALLLATRYRPVLRAVLAEQRLGTESAAPAGP